jgi:tripartite-type tricarboxylate transporter receptor subunit TctC
MNIKKIGIIFISISFIFINATASLCLTKDDYPKKPIEVVVPYAAGGAADLIIRIVGEKMAEYLGQPIIVLNKPGGAAAVGTSFVAKSKPDGYSLLVSTPGTVLRPLVDPTVPYRASEFRPIGIFTKTNYIIVVNKDLQVKNLAELVDYAKKNPGTLSYGFSGVGGASNLAMELLKQNSHMTDVHMQGVPSEGDMPAVLALIGNHVQACVVIVPSTIPHINSNAIRALAILSEKRDPFLPKVLTTVEQGFSEVVSFSYFSLLAPVKTPDYIVNRLEIVMEKALNDKGVQERLMKLYLPISYMNSRVTQEFMDGEAKKWPEVIKKANLGGIKK